MGLEQDEYPKIHDKWYNSSSTTGSLISIPPLPFPIFFSLFSLPSSAVQNLILMFFFKPPVFWNICYEQPLIGYFFWSKGLFSTCYNLTSKTKQKKLYFDIF